MLISLVAIHFNYHFLKVKITKKKYIYIYIKIIFTRWKKTRNCNLFRFVLSLKMWMSCLWHLQRGGPLGLGRSKKEKIRRASCVPFSDHNFGFFRGPKSKFQRNTDSFVYFTLSLFTWKTRPLDFHYYHCFFERDFHLLGILLRWPDCPFNNVKISKNIVNTWKVISSSSLQHLILN